MKIQQEIQQIKDKIHLSVAALLDRSLLTVSLQFAYKSSSMSFVWKTDDVIACVCCLHNVNAAKMFWQSHANFSAVVLQVTIAIFIFAVIMENWCYCISVVFSIVQVVNVTMFWQCQCQPTWQQAMRAVFPLLSTTFTTFFIYWNILPNLNQFFFIFFQILINLLLFTPLSPGPSSWAPPLGWRWGSRGRGGRAGSALCPEQP